MIDKIIIDDVEEVEEETPETKRLSEMIKKSDDLMKKMDLIWDKLSEEQKEEIRKYIKEKDK